MIFFTKISTSFLGPDNTFIHRGEKGTGCSLHVPFINLQQAYCLCLTIPLFLDALRWDVAPKLFTSCLCMPGTQCWCLDWSKSSPDSPRPAAPALLVGRCSPWSHAVPALLIPSLRVSSQPLRARRAFLHFVEV